MAAVLPAKGFMSCSTILRAACLKSPGNKVATKPVTCQRLRLDFAVADLPSAEHVRTQTSIGTRGRLPKSACVHWLSDHCTVVLLSAGEPEAAPQPEERGAAGSIPGVGTGCHGTSGGWGPQGLTSLLGHRPGQSQTRPPRSDHAAVAIGFRRTATM